MARLTILALSVLVLVSAFDVKADVTVMNSAGMIQATVGNDGSYSIQQKLYQWKFSGSIGQRIAQIEAPAGFDSVGSYREIVFYAKDELHRFSIRLYSDSSTILFFVDAFESAPGGIRFPAFKSYPNGLKSLSYLHRAFSPVSFTALGDAPWIFFDPTARTFILSPANHFMISNNFKGADGSISTGVENQVTEWTRSFEYQSVMVLSDGINKAYDTWGNTLVKLGGKKAPANDADHTLATLGYWTDNKASYYYNYVKSLGYPATLRTVQREFRDEGIELGYIQLDSWWYQKGKASSGIYLYEPAHNYFKTSLESFNRSVKVPLVVHARWIDATSPYMWQYRMSNQVSIDPEYWEETMDYLHDGGVETFEQDWLNSYALPRLDRIDDADLFLDNMSEKAAKYGIDLQYCMPLPRHFLQGSRYSNLYSIRPTVDGFNRSKWTQFLYGSRFASALGIWPWADVFFSADRENLLLATLSAGVVGVGDRLRNEDSSADDSSPSWCSRKLDCKTDSASNLRHAVRGDGHIVKPDTSLVPIDSSFLTQAGSPLDTQTMIAATCTYSSSNVVEAAYIFSYAPMGSKTLAAIELNPKDFGITGDSYLYDYFNQKGQFLSSGQTYTDKVSSQGSYYILVPSFATGKFLLGDLNLFVSMGRQRIRVERTESSPPAFKSYGVTFSEEESDISLTGYSMYGAPAVVPQGDLVITENSFEAATGLFKIKLHKPDRLQGQNFYGTFRIQ